MPNESGSTALNATAPTTGSMTRNISSVAYATEESASLAKTASAVGLSSRSYISWSVRSLRPKTRFAMSARRGWRRGRRTRPASSGVGGAESGAAEDGAVGALAAHSLAESLGRGRTGGTDVSTLDFLDEIGIPTSWTQRRERSVSASPLAVKKS